MVKNPNRKTLFGAECNVSPCLHVEIHGADEVTERESDRLIREHNHIVKHIVGGIPVTEEQMNDPNYWN